MDFRVPGKRQLTYLHLLVSLEIGKFTFIAIFFHTDEDIDAVIPRVGPEHVHFFFLHISLLYM